MNANVMAAKFQHLWSRVTLLGKAPAEPELVNCAPRKMTGLFAQMTEEQKKFALSYKGPENHGSPEFLAHPKA